MRDKGDWIYLPHESDLDESPPWPLSTKCDIVYGKGEDMMIEDLHWRELEHWDNLWEKGQSLMWMIDGLQMNVAIYCRVLTKVEAAMDLTSAGILAELRRREEDLGLNAAGLARNKWRFEKSKQHTVEAHELAEDVGAAKAEADNVTDLFAGFKREA